MTTAHPDPSLATTVGPGAIVQLNRTGQAWLIHAGRCEVYALAGGRRVYLAEFGPGETLLCAGVAAGQMIAVAPEGAALLPQATSELPHAQHAALLDAWIGTLSEALSQQGFERPAVRTVAEGEMLQDARGEYLATPRGVLWVGRTGMALRYLGCVPTAQAAPVTHLTWAQVDPDADNHEPVPVFTTSMAVSAGAGADALVLFTDLVIKALKVRFERVAEEEAARALERDALLARSLAEVMDGHENVLDTTVRKRADDPLVYIYRTIGGVPPPGASGRGHADFASFADALHLPYRRIALQEGWWRADVGPIVVRDLKDGSSVAALPDWRGRYRLHRQGSKPEVVDAARAASLDAWAISVVKPLPDRALSWRDLLLAAVLSCRADLATLLVASACASLLGLLVPLATSHIIDTFVPSGLRGQLGILGLLLAVGQLCAFLLKASSDLARQRIDGRVAARLSGGMMDRVLRLPARVLRGFSSTDLAMRVMSVDGMRRTVTGIALNSLLSGLFGLSTIGLLLYYDVYGGLVAFGLFALLAGIGLLAGVTQIKSMLLGEQMTASVSTLTQQLMENIATLRVFGAAKRAYVVWSRNAIEQRRRGLRAKRIGIAFDTMLSGYDLLATAVVFLVLGRASDSMSTGSFLAFASAYAGFLGASIAFGRAMLQVAGILPTYKRVKPLLESEPERASSAEDPGRLSGALEVAGVAFGYGEGPDVLRDVSLRVEPGQFVALVGASGCGKSTLVNLILGIDRPRRGAILFDGRDLADLDVTAVRRQFGVCRQNGRLFSGTLFDNILGAHHGTLEDVWDAARLAGIDAEIRALPMQLHTVVTEGSATFSGGQVQRILLARALMGKPRFVVLDEATSALDNITQDLVVKNIERLGVTRLVVAHRLSTVKNAHLILFIRDGVVAEAGDYATLMAKNGAFASFAQRQSL